MVWKMLFEEFYDGGLMLGSQLFCVTFCLLHPIKFLLKKVYCLEDEDV